MAAEYLVEHPEIEGLSVKCYFLSEEEATSILQEIDQEEWISGENALKRRTQHYGYEYNYKSTQLTKAKPFPSCVEMICDRLIKHNIFSRKPDQLIVNEYLPGQGISAHIDQSVIFGDAVVSVSLCGNCVMTFERKKYKVDLWFLERGIVVLKDDARYKWTHSIASRKNDKIDGVTYPRNRRVSLTFRTIKDI